MGRSAGSWECPNAGFDMPATTRRLEKWRGFSLMTDVTWGPDGLRMVSLIDKQRTEVGTAGLNFFRVTEPTWAPDGSRIAYAAQ